MCGGGYPSVILLFGILAVRLKKTEPPMTRQLFFCILAPSSGSVLNRQDILFVFFEIRFFFCSEPWSGPVVGRRLRFPQAESSPDLLVEERADVADVRDGPKRERVKKKICDIVPSNDTRLELKGPSCAPRLKLHCNVKGVVF